MKMTINNKLKLSFIAIFLLLLFTAIFSILSLNSSIKDIENVILKNQMLQFELLKLDKDILTEINSIKDILAFGENEFLYNKKYSFFTKVENQSKIRINEIKTTYLQTIKKDNSIYTQISNLDKKKDKIDFILHKTLSIYKTQGKNKAYNYLNSKNIYKKYRELTQISSQNRNYYENIFNSALNKKQNTILAIAIIFIIVILIAIFITNTIAKKFTENIKYLILSAEQVSLGQIDTPIETKSGDELEDISKVFEYLRIEIKRNIEKIKQLKH